MKFSAHFCLSFHPHLIFYLKSFITCYIVDQSATSTSPQGEFRHLHWKELRSYPCPVSRILRKFSDAEGKSTLFATINVGFDISLKLQQKSLLRWGSNHQTVYRELVIFKGKFNMLFSHPDTSEYISNCVNRVNTRINCP